MELNDFVGILRAERGSLKLLKWAQAEAEASARTLLKRRKAARAEWISEKTVEAFVRYAPSIFEEAAENAHEVADEWVGRICIQLGIEAVREIEAANSFSKIPPELLDAIRDLVHTMDDPEM